MKDEKEYNRNLSILDLDDVDYKLFNNYQQANIKFKCGTVAFYPGTNKWVFNGNTYKGNSHALIYWMKNMAEGAAADDILNKYYEKHPFGE
jgi:hypothetical protein